MGRSDHSYEVGEGIRTLDIQRGKRNVTSRKRALRISVGGHPMRLLHLLRVDVWSTRSNESWVLGLVDGKEDQS